MRLFDILNKITQRDRTRVAARDRRFSPGTGSPGLSPLGQLAESDRITAAVRQSIAQADRGELIEDNEVLAWLRRQERS